MQITQDELKTKIEEHLGKEIAHLTLKGKGDCNYAYYVETVDGGKFIVKQEREQKETEDQNDLIVEGTVIRQLRETGISIPLPCFAFVADNPKLYGYEYIEGILLRGVWNTFSEEEKIDICNSLGQFHAEIGMKFTKEMAEASGVDINPSVGFHPVVVTQYNKWTVDPALPDSFKDLVKEAKRTFEGTSHKVVFQFIHNDGHPENIIIKDKKISGIIDFGDAEYGEVAKEFSRYIRDLPDHFMYIVSSYERISGKKLSYVRLVSNALISGFNEIAEDYMEGGEKRLKAERDIERYKKLLSR